MYCESAKGSSGRLGYIGSFVSELGLLVRSEEEVDGRRIEIRLGSRLEGIEYERLVRSIRTPSLHSIQSDQLGSTHETLFF
jgi:hypothetical protein